jgi:serine protease Do
VDDQTTDKPVNETAASDKLPLTSKGASRQKPMLLTASTSDESAPVSEEARAADAAPLTAVLTGKSTAGPRLRKQPLGYALGAIVVLALGFGGGWLGAASHNGSTSGATVAQQKVVLEGQATVISNIAKNVGPSVVSVNVTAQSQSSSPYASLFGMGGNGDQTEQSAGTGIILTGDGLIMTNRHVVPSGTTSVSVTLSDGTVYNNVKVVGRTSDSDSLDVAFLQIPDTKGKTLKPASIGDSSKVNIGDTVVAIGNALGQFQNTVTSGIISGYGRSVQASDSTGSSSENLDNLFQTDAAINEGNSGGPLVNLDGQVIGMNTAVASNSQSIGFAIPINDLSGLIESVKSTGKLQKPYLGVVYIPITNDVASEYNLKVSQGAYVPTSGEVNGQDTVINGSPADKAGVEPGDIITKVDGAAVNQSTSLTSLLGKHKVGDTVTLTIIRDGKTITKSVTLESAPTS